ncbi:DUF805 domain-containing protein [Buttiauxella sp. 3AFRM03]|uniref:DUF805 domain-containing protein n=1 Tax=Buttiauxella sp. 3AFRM03 TaxID=2479367 RepID=UPI000EF7A000|nr:DUF805 domain-containing protein [Buttiauxella sp. 3AFRM03]AYN27016.1 DUF805 domain-containing protein [Buttiauxella sp. 3AFRM03]
MFFITNAIDGYRKVFCYKGVTVRKPYFFFTLFQFVFLVLLDLISDLLESFTLDLDYDTLFGCVALLLIYPILLTTISVIVYSFLAGLSFTVRRFHDFGLSGWWVIPYIGVTFVALAVFTILAALALGILSDDEPTRDIANKVAFIVCIYVASFGLSLLAALPKSKIENNKYRTANSISIPATDEAVS